MQIPYHLHPALSYSLHIQFQGPGNTLFRMFGLFLEFSVLLIGFSDLFLGLPIYFQALRSTILQNPEPFEMEIRGAAKGRTSA